MFEWVLNNSLKFIYDNRKKISNSVQWCKKSVLLKILKEWKIVEILPCHKYLCLMLSWTYFKRFCKSRRVNFPSIEVSCTQSFFVDSCGLRWPQYLICLVVLFVIWKNEQREHLVVLRSWKWQAMKLYSAAKLFSAWLKGCLSELAWLVVLFLSRHSTPISRWCRFVIFCSFIVFFPIHWRLTGQQRKWGDHLYSSLLFPPAHKYSGIYLQLYIWDDYHVFSNTLLVATRLLPDEVYHLIEF